LNDAAREVLVAAALRGHKQATRHYHKADGSDCALGVLHATLHATRVHAMDCAAKFAIAAVDAEGDLMLIAPIHDELEQHFGISRREAREITERNDRDKWDFLAIAYKVGIEQEAP
jgi:hypothetical protein